ncbi:MAG: hypothetical protein ACM3UU_00395 [Ignavibacteriales bacterium]
MDSKKDPLNESSFQGLIKTFFGFSGLKNMIIEEGRHLSFIPQIGDTVVFPEAIIVKSDKKMAEIRRVVSIKGKVVERIYCFPDKVTILIEPSLITDSIKSNQTDAGEHNQPGENIKYIKYKGKACIQYLNDIFKNDEEIKNKDVKLIIEQAEQIFRKDAVFTLSNFEARRAFQWAVLEVIKGRIFDPKTIFEDLANSQSLKKPDSGKLKNFLRRVAFHYHKQGEYNSIVIEELEKYVKNDRKRVHYTPEETVEIIEIFANAIKAKG